MNAAIGLLGLAYIAGLLASGVNWGIYGLGAIALLAMFFRRQLGVYQLRPILWLMAWVLSLTAMAYLNLRQPHPSTQDISRWVQSERAANAVVVSGRVESVPKLTRSQKAQFWLSASSLTHETDLHQLAEQVQGKLYVTTPLLQATGLAPGDIVTIDGQLYTPQASGGRCLFDFQAFLAQNGSFAGLSGQQVQVIRAQQRGWSISNVQQQIVRSQTQGLGVPAGPLVSAMVLGNQAVDIPQDIKDGFIRSGLCHALAASGFQVSLILGAILSLTQRFSSRVQGGVGVLALLIFGLLAGPQPSVVRAVLMGMAVLVGVISNRAVNPLNALFAIATLMLVVNPHWIWDIGFQLSFLATLGLIVTVPVLSRWLDWLPPVIASLIAVPVAAMLWTLPIQLYHFCLISPYSLIANIIAAPLISLVSLGGFISALFSVVWPTLGSWSAWVLYYPTLLLMQLVQGISTLPGHLIAIGTISILQVIVIYALGLGVWLVPQLKKRHWWVFGLSVLILIVPTVSLQTNKVQVSVLDHSSPLVVMQDQGFVGLWSLGKVENLEFTLLPFLRQQGINQIDFFMGRSEQEDAELRKHVSLKSSYWQTIREYRTQSMSTSGVSSITLAPVNPPPNIQYDPNPAPNPLKTQAHEWWVYGGDQEPRFSLGSRANVLVWSGAKLSPAWLQNNSIQVAIATGKLDGATREILSQKQVLLYSVQDSGAIAWTPDQGIVPLQELQTPFSKIP